MGNGGALLAVSFPASGQVLPTCTVVLPRSTTPCWKLTNTYRDEPHQSPRDSYPDKLIMNYHHKGSEATGWNLESLLSYSEGGAEQGFCLLDTPSFCKFFKDSVSNKQAARVVNLPPQMLTDQDAHQVDSATFLIEAFLSEDD